jgi:hypothetical protein
MWGTATRTEICDHHKHQDDEETYDPEDEGAQTHLAKGLAADVVKVIEVNVHLAGMVSVVW